MGSKPKTPAPTAEESALRKEQAETLKFSRGKLTEVLDRADLARPELLEQLGFSTNEEGGLVGGDEQSALSGAAEEFGLSVLDRATRASKGEVDTNPFIEEQIRLGEIQRVNEGRKGFGSGFDESSIGVESARGGRLNAALLRRSGQESDIRLGSLGLQGIESGQNLSLARVGGAQSLLLGGVPAIGGFTNIASGFGQAAGSFQADRFDQSQNNRLAYQGTQDTIGSIIGGGAFITGRRFG